MLGYTYRFQLDLPVARLDEIAEHVLSVVPAGGRSAPHWGPRSSALESALTAIKFPVVSFSRDGNLNVEFLEGSAALRLNSGRLAALATMLSYTAAHDMTFPQFSEQNLPWADPHPPGLRVRAGRLFVVPPLAIYRSYESRMDMGGEFIEYDFSRSHLVRTGAGSATLAPPVNGRVPKNQLSENAVYSRREPLPLRLGGRQDYPWHVMDEWSHVRPRLFGLI